MSSRPVSGRRPEAHLSFPTLFDSRYRVDQVFPRGQAGESLSAFDTQDGDAPVLIKRPALQDAPPMRAGQEQTLLSEKRVLEKLAGVPIWVTA